MVCSKCNNDNNSTERNFCSKCGALLIREDKSIEKYEEYFYNKSAIENKMRLLKCIASTITVIAIVVSMYGFKINRDVDKYINLVKEGTFENHKSITIEDGFEKYFENPSWNYINSEEGYNLVEFTGHFNKMGEDILAVIQFHIYDNNTFEPSYLSFVDASQDKSVLYDLIDKVMNSY